MFPFMVAVTLAGLLVVVVIPLWIVFHYAVRWRALRALSPDDERMVEDLWQTLPRLEARINALERILDDTTPDWRTRI